MPNGEINMGDLIRDYTKVIRQGERVITLNEVLAEADRCRHEYGSFGFEDLNLIVERMRGGCCGGNIMD